MKKLKKLANHLGILLYQLENYQVVTKTFAKQVVTIINDRKCTLIN